MLCLHILGFPEFPENESGMGAIVVWHSPDGVKGKPFTLPSGGSEFES